ncbi:MAG: SHOCT domain-containing protein [Desulfobacca sp.]|uniref:SHOCT domain-containing protein n=1 Tax=Desulfobacca sp. TaxID=2067990 RepID=UPI00404A33E7
MYYFFRREGCPFPLLRDGKGSAEPESALDILKRRYARGELTREEFLQMKQDIS